MDILSALKSRFPADRRFQYFYQSHVNEQLQRRTVMNRQPLVKRIVWLLVLGIMFEVLMFPPSGGKVKADDVPYSCIQQYGFCLYSCAGITDEEAYLQCTAPCELSNNECNLNGDQTDPL